MAATLKSNFIAFCALLLFARAAAAQLPGPHLLGTGELQAPSPPQAVGTPQPNAGKTLPAPPGFGRFMLKGVVIEGASSVPLHTLKTAWKPVLGQMVNAAALTNIARQIGIFENNAGIVLYTVSFLPQNVPSGIVHVEITEASVTHVEIIGKTEHQKLGLLSTYARNIMQSRPLRRDILERNILLMGDMARAKIGSKFVPMQGHLDAVQLVLAIQPIKFFSGFDINNQESPALGSTQAVVNAGVNNLFREGERTQFIIGVPLNFARYQYYGLNDIEPLGGNGLTASFAAGELISRPAGQAESGAAQLFDVRLNEPVIRSVRMNLNVSAGLNYLNSNNAFLGFTTSDERTRAFRLAVSYNDSKYFSGIDALSASVSQGIDALGARRASVAYGSPVFTKGNFDIERLQPIPLGFALRLALTGQFTPDRLPPSEEFEYGGPIYGQAFYAAELTGDEGIAALAEVAHTLPSSYLPKALTGTALFALADYGRVWNLRTIYVEPTDRGASFGGGIKFLLFQKFQLELAAATPIIKPEYIGNNERWRFVAVTSGRF